jgi:hypothetical protein
LISKDLLHPSALFPTGVISVNEKARGNATRLYP